MPYVLLILGVKQLYADTKEMTLFGWGLKRIIKLFKGGILCLIRVEDEDKAQSVPLTAYSETVLQHIFTFQKSCAKSSLNTASVPSSWEMKSGVAPLL